MDNFEDNVVLRSSLASKRHNKLRERWLGIEAGLYFYWEKRYVPSYEQSLKSSKILDFIRKTIDIVVQYLYFCRFLLIPFSCPKEEKKGKGERLTINPKNVDGVELWVYSLQAYFNRWVWLAVHCADIIFPVYLAAPSILVAEKVNVFPGQ